MLLAAFAYGAFGGALAARFAARRWQPERDSRLATVLVFVFSAGLAREAARVTGEIPVGVAVSLLSVLAVVIAARACKPGAA